MVINSTVKWGPAFHRFGQKFDHGLVSAKWRWRTKATVKKKRHNFKAMSSQSWPEFDTDLRIRLQKKYETTGQGATQVAGKDTDDETAELSEEFAHLTKCVYETICKVVPEKKKWIKKNGRVVSQGTKELFEKRAKEFSKQKPTKQRRQKWNRTIRNACRNDYRAWVSNWVEAIEKADNAGDTKEIYRGVKALSGQGQKRGRTRPTKNSEK